MSLVRLENVAKSFHGDAIFENVSFQIEENERIGLIGRNGSGKSTLFNLVTGSISPDVGTIERMKRARVSWLAQMPDVAPTTNIFDVVLLQFKSLLRMEKELSDIESKIEAGASELIDVYGPLRERFEIEGGYEFRSKIKRILCGLGFLEDDFTMEFQSLSGGQRTRLMLALILVGDSDLILLDEPENHLDLAAREWLENFLMNWPKSLVVISHDRQLLNAVSTRTIEVEHGQIWQYSGNYDAYMENKVLRLEQQENEYNRQQRFIKKEEQWINRFRYKNTKAKAVQSRIKQLDRLDKVQSVQGAEKVSAFAHKEVVRSGQLVLKVSDLSKSYPGLKLYDDVSFSVERGERVGIIGANGTGKSTLLKHIAGTLEDCGGTVELGHKVTVGYFDQHHESLDVDLDIVSYFEKLYPNMKTETIRSYLGQFLFQGQDVFKSLRSLSGGEKNRVAMAKLIHDNNNLLLLDEPTNHLDIISREILEESLTHYSGTILLVSHDRLLIDHLVNKLIILGDGHAEVFLGNYSHYKWKKKEDSVFSSTIVSDEVLNIRTREDSPDVVEQSGNKQRRERQKELRRMESRLKKLEESIESSENESSTMTDALHKTDPTDFELLSALSVEKEKNDEILEKLVAEWEELHSEIDVAKSLL
jgi:ATP-binding cassette subfamily F protein 3